MYKIILVDDNKMFRESLGYFLEHKGLVSIIGEASDKDELIDLLETQKPDILIMNILMSDLTGISTIENALKLRPELKIIIITDIKELDHYYNLIESGLKGIILKSSGIAEIQDAIFKVTEGESYVSHELIEKIVSTVFEKETVFPEFEKNETEIIQLICNNTTSEEITEKINITNEELPEIMKKIYSKTNSSNTTSLIMFTVMNNLIKL